MKIAILALQGAFLEHEKALSKLGIDCFEIRQAADWNNSKDALIIPGGESTTMLKLLKELNLYNSIRNDIQKGMPVFGTCAGLILLAKNVVGDNIERLSTMNMTVCRNAYGRQLGSFHTYAPFKGIDHDIPMTFIRAPYIKRVEDDVEILSVVDNNIVAARQDNQLVAAFHPELDNDDSIHKMFIDMVEKSK